jgi:hypothetical protein
MNWQCNWGNLLNIDKWMNRSLFYFSNYKYFIEKMYRLILQHSKLELQGVLFHKRCKNVVAGHISFCVKKPLITCTLHWYLYSVLAEIMETYVLCLIHILKSNGACLRPGFVVVIDRWFLHWDFISQKM